MFGSWSVPESPITIEYSLVVIEEIRREVTEGFQRLSRRGIEVGGVLYGMREGRTVRITAMRPIACEHAHGPAFLLSDNDRVALQEQLVQEKDDPRLEGLISVGWFLSHTRAEISLTESDLEIYSIFFPAPWQVTLVVRPGRGGSMRGGFFIREGDGSVKTDHSYLDFNFPDRLAGVLDRPVERAPRPRVPVERPLPTLQRAATVPATPPRRDIPREISRAPMPPIPVPEFLPVQRPPRRWPWLAGLAVLVVALILAGLRYWMLHSITEPISLAVIEREGQLQIDWNASAKPVASARRGFLEIVDGTTSRTFELTPRDLATGKYAYTRKSGDIEVRMTVENAEGARTQEASRFLGRPPPASIAATSQELLALQQRRDQLEAEVRQLRQENGTQAARIRQLERTLRILQTRLGIVERQK